MTDESVPVLQVLGDHGRTVAETDVDIRGFRVEDRNGEDIGKVDALLVDATGNTVRMMRIAHGGVLGLGATMTFVPVEAVARVDDQVVHVDRTRVDVGNAPTYDPDVVDQPVDLLPLYTYYGYPPFWS